MYSVFLYCFCIVLFIATLLSRHFPISVQVYRPLPNGENPTVVNKYHIISYHIISYHIISYHIVSYHIISWHIMSCHAISYIMSCHILYIISYHVMSYHIIPYHIYHIVSCHVTSCHVISYHISYHINMLYCYRPQTACNTKCEICSILQGSRRRSLFSKYILKNTVCLLLKQRDICVIFNIQYL